jgi:hypothetical protein
MNKEGFSIIAFQFSTSCWPTCQAPIPARPAAADAPAIVPRGRPAAPPLKALRNADGIGVTASVMAEPITAGAAARAAGIDFRLSRIFPPSSLAASSIAPASMSGKSQSSLGMLHREFLTD